MKSLLKNTRFFLVFLFGLFLVLNGLVWKQLIRQVETDRQETVRSAVQHNNNLAVALEQHTIRTIRVADVSLRSIKMEYERQMDKFTWQSLADNSLLNLSGFHLLLITDSVGNVVARHPEQAGPQTVNVSDRDFFQAQRNATDTLVINKPIVSRLTHKPVVVFSRGLRDHNGRFRGVVAMQLLPSAFMSFYSRANIKKYDILSLISPDGITYSRRWGTTESWGEDIAKSPLFRHLRQKPVGHYFAKDAIHGIPTYFSYRTLKNLPVIATVGSSERDILESFRQRRRQTFLYGFVTSCLLFLFLLVVLLFFAERRRSLQALKKSEAKYRSIFEGSYDAVLLLTEDGAIEAMNEAACAMFRLSVLRGEKVFFWQLYEQSEPESFFSIDGNNRFCLENREVLFHCLNGQKFIGEIASSAFSVAGGTHYRLVLIRDVTQRKRMEQKLHNEQKRYQRQLTKHIITAQESEREIIGRELHDNVNQILTTVKLYLETALHTTNDKPELVSTSIRHIGHCITEIRNLSHSLTAPTLGTQSLVDSLQTLVDEVSKCGRFDVEFCMEKFKLPISKELNLALYRIAQEQFSNIIKHANATAVKMELTQTETETQLVVADNGQGFDPQTKSNGIGLTNIASRVKAFNGRLSIESAVGGGCRVVVHLPHSDEVPANVPADWY
jgi:PAS domain S-box-containing protein